MKVSFAQDVVKESHGLQGQSSFNIRQNAHAFKMLSSGLYSDKIRAVLREIGCNAADAHIAHGTPDLPIVVKLPTKLDNQFYIQDHGPGLSHDEVMGLYTTYFASTKQTSNEFTGAFGLGSKSPFSYTDSFVVTSVHGGKKRIYSAHLGNDGMPTIALMSETEADKDWPHGIRVGFPVKTEDFQWFAQKAQLVFQYFRVLPTVLGGEAISPPQKLIQSGRVYRMVPGSTDTGNNVVVMGNVAYPIDASRLEDSTGRLARVLGGMDNICIEMPIGSVQVAASREELQYDKDSLKNLKQALYEAIDTIAKDMVVKANDAASSWEGRITSGAALVTHWIDTRSYYTDAIKFLLEMAKVPPTDRELILSFIGSRMSVPAPTKAVRRLATWNKYRGRIRFEEIKHDDISLMQTVVLYGPRTHCIAKVMNAFNQLDQAKRLEVQYIVFTPMLNSSQTEADAKDEAVTFANFLRMKAPPVDLRTLPLPVTYAPAKKTSRAKTATVAPLPQIDRPGFDVHGKMEPSPLHERDKLYMCSFSSSSGWGSSGTSVRPGVDTIAKEVSYTVPEFGSMWSRFTYVLKRLGLNNDLTVFSLPLSEIRSMDLVKRGWNNAVDAAKTLLGSTSVRDAMKKYLGQWKPTVNVNSWLGRLNIYLNGADKGAGLPKEALKLAKSVEAHQTKKEDASELYEEYIRTCNSFDVSYINVSYSTINDLEVELQKKYPRTQFISAFVLDMPDRADFVKLIFK